MQLDATQSKATNSLTLAKLRWQCRRGMLELDLLLVLFLEEVYPTLTAREQSLFSDLLEYPDPTLYHWFLATDFDQIKASTDKEPADKTLWPIIQKIRAHSRHIP